MERNRIDILIDTLRQVKKAVDVTSLEIINIGIDGFTKNSKDQNVAMLTFTGYPSDLQVSSEKTDKL